MQPRAATPPPEGPALEPRPFLLFGLVGTVAFVLAFAAGEAANRRGDARVLLLSLAFMATGGFMGLHALGTPGVLFTTDHSGFKVAILVGLLVSAGFAAASAFVDVRPGFAALAIRHRRALRVGVLLAMAGWFVWTIANLPPLDGAKSEAARGSRALRLQQTDIAGANRLWTRLDREITNKALWVPLYNVYGADLVSKRVGNYRYNPVRGALLSQLWVR